MIGGSYGGRRAAYYSSEILGVVPAFAIGVQRALEDGADIIACLHDDLLIQQYAWDLTVKHFFYAHPRCGLVGFGGGTGLGAGDIYQTPYNPMQLARQDFVSNMQDAEAHGRRGLVPERVACLDGFSQIGRREFWRGFGADRPNVICPTCKSTGFGASAWKAGQCLFCDGTEGGDPPQSDLFSLMQSWGVVHHFYDGMLGAFAKRLGWEVWMLPVAVHHLGGQTAVGDPAYHQWANQQLTITEEHTDTVSATGDQAFWRRAHEIGYAQFKDVLPIRISKE